MQRQHGFVALAYAPIEAGTTAEEGVCARETSRIVLREVRVLRSMLSIASATPFVRWLIRRNISSLVRKMAPDFPHALSDGRPMGIIEKLGAVEGLNDTCVLYVGHPELQNRVALASALSRPGCMRATDIAAGLADLFPEET